LNPEGPTIKLEKGLSCLSATFYSQAFQRGLFDWAIMLHAKNRLNKISRSGPHYPDKIAPTTSV
jgi:hypothetical protein